MCSLSEDNHLAGGKMMPKTSIVVVAWDTNRIQRQITSACLGNIAKFTNRDEYELILVDQCNKQERLDNKHNLIDIDTPIPLDENIGSSAAMNLGYKHSNPEYPYICFMHNDVFVPDNWLTILRELVDRSGTAVMPTQGRMDRKFVKKAQTEESFQANDDAGLVIMTKEFFKQTGGWDERFKTIYMDAPFRQRFPKKYICTNQCIITHIGAVGYYHDAQFETESYAREAPIYNDLIKNNTGKDTNYLNK